MRAGESLRWRENRFAIVPFKKTLLFMLVIPLFVKPGTHQGSKEIN